MQITVDISGPLFRSGSKPARKAIKNSIREVTELGHERMAERLVPRPSGVYLTVPPGTSMGHYRRSIHHMIKDDRAIIDDSNVVYGPWLEVGGGRFKGYHVFRKTRGWMQEIAPKVLQGWVKKAVREMGG